MDYHSLPPDEQRLIEKSYDSGQHLYFIKTGNTVKIGKAQSPQNRLAIMQTGTPREMRILLVAPFCGGLLEGYIHKLLKAQGAHYRGEWFKYNEATKATMRILGEILKEVGVKYHKRTEKVVMFG